jgi:hypothetical protein
LVLTTDTEQFLDRDAASLFKKRVIAEFHKKKDKSRPPSNLDAPNVVLPYDRNFFTFWMSSIKLSAQLFKSTKLEFKCLTHIDDRFLTSHNFSSPAQVMISATSFLLPFPSFRFEGLAPPSVEQQQSDAIGEAPAPDSSGQIEHPLSSVPIMPTCAVEAQPPHQSQSPLSIDPLQQLQEQLLLLNARNQAQEINHQKEMASITASITQLTQLLSGLQSGPVSLTAQSAPSPPDNARLEDTGSS